MGFLDKAKKMAEQAQSKLDEVQKQFNEGQSGPSGSQASPVEYDKHGRPIRSEAPPEPAAPPSFAPTPPHGDPVAGQASAPPPPPPAPAAPRVGGSASAAPATSEGDRYAPPKLTGGDPLAG